MHSPLPDASALEAGIIEDELPSRISRVQENVRNLLRNSSFSRASSIPPASTVEQFAMNHGMPTPPVSPPAQSASYRHSQASPRLSAESTSSAASSAPTTPRDEVSEAGLPPAHYRHALQQMAHQSALFNSRAVAALDHPDLSHPSLAAHLQSAKMQQQSHRRRPRHKRKQTAAVQAAPSHWFFCVLTALLLAATVATYIVLATTSNDATPTFHVLFALGIILAAIVFIHSILRLLRAGKNSNSRRKITTPPRLRRYKHRHPAHARGQSRRPHATPPLSSEPTAFIPTSPIPVHVAGDEVRPDSRDARPTTIVRIAEPPAAWDKPVDALANPPPAYGRWRGSVRADPELLHWQAVPPPVHPPTPALPSPTYEEAMAAGRTGPPSYATRNSPARAKQTQDRAVQYQPPTVEPESEPEMFEVRGGVGIAV